MRRIPRREGKIMKMHLMLAALLGVSAIAAAHAQPPANAQDFVTNAAIGGMFEVQSSQLALDKAHGKDVKGFARMMIRDHTKANDKLKKVAAEQKLAVPSDLDAAHQGDLDTLRKTKGPFDPTYVAMQRKAHEEAVTLFETYAKDGTNGALKSFASATLPTLEMHRRKITAIARKDKID
jgi:putative membrane protein